MSLMGMRKGGANGAYEDDLPPNGSASELNNTVGMRAPYVSVGQPSREMNHHMHGDRGDDEDGDSHQPHPHGSANNMGLSGGHAGGGHTGGDGDEYTGDEDGDTGKEMEGEHAGPDKTSRRLAQNREAARKSRLRKKAYVQQLESSRQRLEQLENELAQARSQLVTAGAVPAQLPDAVPVASTNGTASLQGTAQGLLPGASVFTPSPLGDAGDGGGLTGLGMQGAHGRPPADSKNMPVGKRRRQGSPTNRGGGWGDNPLGDPLMLPMSLGAGGNMSGGGAFIGSSNNDGGIGAAIDGAGGANCLIPMGGGGSNQRVGASVGVRQGGIPGMGMGTGLGMLGQSQAGGLAGGLGGLGGGALNGSAAAFDQEYARWREEHKRLVDDVRMLVNSRSCPDEELSVSVSTALSQYEEIYNLKRVAAKQDVFHLVSGMWKTPAERCFMWMGGFRPSDMVKILIPHMEPLSEHQLLAMCNIQNNCQQGEEVLSQGMEALQQSLADIVSSSTPAGGADLVGSYMGQMAMAMTKLGAIESFVLQVGGS
eukprot:jgi/Mesvir1/720/Mv17328-RA.1